MFKTKFVFTLVVLYLRLVVESWTLSQSILKIALEYTSGWWFYTSTTSCTHFEMTKILTILWGMQPLSMRFPILPLSMVILIQFFLAFSVNHPNHKSSPKPLIINKIPNIKISSLINLNSNPISLITQHLPLINFAFGTWDNPLPMSFGVDNSTHIHFAVVKSHFDASEMIYIAECSRVEGERLVFGEVLRYLFGIGLA